MYAKSILLTYGFSICLLKAIITRPSVTFRTMEQAKKKKYNSKFMENEHGKFTLLYYQQIVVWVKRQKCLALITFPKQWLGRSKDQISGLDRNGE